jgi:hypothetical protein
MRNETEVLMLALGIDLFLPDGPPKYRDFDYAWSQVAKLAHQIVDEPQLEKPPLGPEPWCKECLKPLSECEDKANHKGYMSPTGRSLAKNIEFNQARVLDKMVGFDSETRSIKGWDQGAPDGDHTYVTVLVWNPGLNAHEPQTWRTDDPRYLAMQVAMPLELLNRKKN